MQNGSAAVAIIQCKSPWESFLVLRRAPHPNDPWSGHFSFPGGKKDPADKSLLATCMRETREETGIVLHSDQLLRKMGMEPAGSNLRNPLLVQPFIFQLDEVPLLSLQQSEISGALWLDKEKFRDLSAHQRVEMLPGRTFPAYPVDDYFIWGFTYRLLVKICELPVI